MMEWTKRHLGAVAVILVLAAVFVAPAAADAVFLKKSEAVFRASAGISAPQNNLSLGIDAGKSLNYGRVPKGTNITKHIEFSVARPTEFTVTARGNITEQLVYDSPVYVESTARIPMKLAAREEGYYKGKIVLTGETLKQDSRMGERWLAFKSQYLPDY